MKCFIFGNNKQVCRIQLCINSKQDATKAKADIPFEKEKKLMQRISRLFDVIGSSREILSNHDLNTHTTHPIQLLTWHKLTFSPQIVHIIKCLLVLDVHGAV